MKEEPVDPRMEKLVASLYKELSPDEERELQELLKRDPALRAEYDELVSMRSMLGEWEVEEKVPSFVMVDPEPARRVSAAGFWDGLREKLGGFFAVSGWAVAAAALVVLVLTLKGWRLETIDGGFAVRTGPKTNATETGPGGVAPSGSQDDVPASARLRDHDDDDAPAVQTVGARYVTQKDLDDKSMAMLRTFAELLNNDRARRDAETSSMLRTIYGNLNDRQSSNYQDLRGRIEAVGLGLMAEQSRTNERLQLVQQTVADSLGFEKKSPDENGGEKK